MSLHKVVGIIGKIKKEETYIKSPTNEFAMYQPPANPVINPIKQQVPTDTVIVYKLYPIIPPNRTPIIRNMLIHNNTNNKFFASFFIIYSPSLGRYFYSVSSHYITLVFRENIYPYNGRKAKNKTFLIGIKDILVPLSFSQYFIFI